LKLLRACPKSAEFGPVVPVDAFGWAFMRLSSVRTVSVDLVNAWSYTKSFSDAGF